MSNSSNRFYNYKSGLQGSQTKFKYFDNKQRDNFLGTQSPDNTTLSARSTISFSVEQFPHLGSQLLQIN
jgi:hypothetical protein